MSNRLPALTKELEKGRRKIARRVAAQLVLAMAETDSDYAFIGMRIEQDPREIERWLMGLVSGQTKDLDTLSDLLLAMGLEFEFSLRRYAEPMRPGEQVTEATAEAA